MKIRISISVVAAMFGMFIVGFGMMVMIPAVAFGAPPVNDNFADAIEITGVSGQTSGTNVEATSEENESYYIYSVWWAWTAPADGYYTFDTDGSGFWTMLQIYSEDSEVSSNYGGRETFYAQAGKRYSIAVSGEETGHITLNWRTAHPPVNDNFTDAIEITGTSGSVSGTGIDATIEAGELVYGFGKSVWWKWTAPVTGTCVFDSIGTDPDAILVLYTGSDIQHLEMIGYNTGTGGVDLQVQAGTQYFIVVDGPGKGTVKLNWELKIPPANDNFADAIEISGASGQTTGTNVDATSEIDESDVWWAWTAPASGYYTFDTDGSNSGTVFRIYTGSTIQDLVKVSSNDNQFYAQSGKQYFIAVSGQNTGDIILNWRPAHPPANDNFADAIEIIGASGQTTGTNVDATVQDDEPNQAGYQPRNSVWWKWTAPASGYYTFNTDGSNSGTVFRIYTGSTIQDLIKVLSNDSQSVFYAQSGKRYFIDVSGWQTGNITLNWRTANPPANDNFENAIEITGTSGSINGTVIDATNEEGEPITIFGKSVWWTWTAPATRNFIFDNIGSDPDNPFLAIYTGSDIQHLKLVTYTYGGIGGVTLEAQAGAQYFIQVDGEGKGNVKLNWKLKIPPTNDNFADAAILTGSQGKAAGTNLYATCEAAEFNCYGQSVWWTWTAPAAGNYLFDISESDFTAILTVYTGSGLANLTKVAVGNGKLSFSAEAGITYHISVDGYESGNIALKWDFKLEISSVYPSTGMIGKNLPITITGTGFDADTHVSMYPSSAIIGSVKTPGYVTSVAVSGSIAYAVSGEYKNERYYSTLQVFDISNLSNPAIIGSVEIPGADYVSNISVSGSLAYVVNDTTIQIIDVSNPKNPKIVGAAKIPIPASSYVYHTLVSDSIAYVTMGYENNDTGGRYGILQILDIRNPQTPEIIGTVNTPYSAKGISVSGSTAYITDGYWTFNSSLKVIDLSDLKNPKIIGSVETGHTMNVSVSGSVAYLIDDYGLQAIDVSDPRNPKIIATLDVSDTSTRSDLIISGSVAYLPENGLVADISNPKNPVIIGEIKNGYCAAIMGNNALIGTENGLVIVPLPVEVKPILINDKTLSVTLPSPQIPGNYTIRVFNNNSDSAELVGVVRFDMPGVVSGQITDIYGNPIPNALIRTANQDSASSQTDGRYRLICRTGNNVITVAAAGYYEMQQAISVPESGEYSLNFRLTPIPSPPLYQPTPEERGSIAVGEDLALNICARYRGQTFGFVLNFAPNPHGINGVFWKANPATLKQIQSSSPACIDVGDDLTLNIRAEYRGAGYSFPMSFYPYPDAASASEFLWEADPSSLRVIY